MNRDRLETIFGLQEKAFAEIRKNWAAVSFQYIDLETAQPLYFITVGRSGWLCVIGNPDNGSYEWASYCDEVAYDHSNCGYGEPAVAMRDGLNRILDW